MKLHYTRMDTMRRLLVAILILCAQNLFAQPLVHITFERDEVGKFPSGWQSRDENDGIKVYSVQAEGEKKFLHADARDQSVQISYEQKWPLADYPDTSLALAGCHLPCRFKRTGEGRG